jgi:hypothetical protein
MYQDSSAHHKCGRMQGSESQHFQMGVIIVTRTTTSVTNVWCSMYLKM